MGGARLPGNSQGTQRGQDFWLWRLAVVETTRLHHARAWTRRPAMGHGALRPVRSSRGAGSGVPSVLCSVVACGLDAPAAPKINVNVVFVVRDEDGPGEAGKLGVWTNACGLLSWLSKRV